MIRSNLFRFLIIKNWYLNTQKELKQMLQSWKMSWFFISEFEVYKAKMYFPNGSRAGPDKVVPLVFKDLIIKSNGNAWLNFLKSITKLLNLIGEGKVLVLIAPTVNRVIFLTKIPSLWLKTEHNTVITMLQRFLLKQYRR